MPNVTEENSEQHPQVRVDYALGRYRFHWKTGKPDEAEGNDVAAAFASLGYGGGALAALDYWEQL